jgi:hypothetical protein
MREVPDDEHPEFISRNIMRNRAKTRPCTPTVVAAQTYRPTRTDGQPLGAISAASVIISIPIVVLVRKMYH